MLFFCFGRWERGGNTWLLLRNIQLLQIVFIWHLVATQLMLDFSTCNVLIIRLIHIFCIVTVIALMWGSFKRIVQVFLNQQDYLQIRSRGFNTNVFFLWDLLADYGGSLGIGMIKPALVQWCKSSFKCVTLRYSSNICITLVNLIENMFDDRWSMFNILALT